MLLASLLFVSLDTVAKYLTATYPVEQIVWARFSFHLLVALIIMSPQGFGRLKSNQPWLQLLRSAFMLGANAFFFLALQSIPLVTASAVVFVGPLLVTALSVPLLGERVGPRRWAAVAVGFAGAMLIIRPGTDFMHAATVLPLLAALSFSFYQICTRILARHDDPMTTLTYTAVAGSLAATAIVPTSWITPDTVGWMAMIAAGIFGALGQWALIKAISAAPVSTIAPFGYTGLVWATLFGFVTFGDIPDLYTLCGAVIIAASGLYVLHRERALSRSAPTN